MTSPDTRKSVLITGAGVGGIGGALAKQFHAKGYRVFAAARRPETVRELVELGIESVALDVTRVEDVKRARDEVSAKTGGRLDVLVNNAGIGVSYPASDLNIETEVKDMFEVNVFGVMRMVQEFVHLLIAAEGTIVNIGSIGPIVPLLYGSAYNASKAALHAYADTLRIELKPFNVHVMTIITGGVKSNIVRDTERQLPPNSLYRPVADGFRARVNISQENTSTNADDYARSVVAQVMRRKGRQPVWFWEARFSRVAWFLYTFMWKGFSDVFMYKKFGLDRLAESWKKQKAGK